MELNVQHLTTTLDGKTIVNGISFTAAAGTAVAVPGPNGAGKSTLIRTLSGVLKPDGGSIRWDGSDIHQLSRFERARLISYLPQNMAYGAGYSVKDFIALASHPWDGLRDRDRNDELLEKVIGQCRIEVFSDRDISTLSGGERQRVYLAQVIYQDTPIILLDEPGSFQDLHNLILVEEIIAQLKGEGKLILCITHELQTIRRVCDQVVALKGGSLFYCGDPSGALSIDTLSRLFEIDEKALRERYTGYINHSTGEVLSGL